MPPFKDEHVLIIAPGSVTTEAQLGLPESFTPPRWRFATRMFPSQTPGEWEPVRIRSKLTTIPKPIEAIPPAADGPPAIPLDVEMNDAVQSADTTAPMQNGEEPTTETQEEIVEVFEDDPFESEGAVYPMRAGTVENWPCFFALLSHIYNTISPPFHTPVLVVTQPCWTSRDHELITTYFFENWKIPALCLMDAALTACYAYGVPTAMVVDVGHEKCDVTAVTEFVVNDIGRGAKIEGCGGRAMTLRLQEVLQDRGFDEQMAEQLKKSPICEILPSGTPYPKGSAPAPQIEAPNPAAAASTGALDSGPAARDADGLRPGQAIRADDVNGADEEENEGVLDVVAIVAKDNAAELLAKREREKAERMAAKKGGAPEPQRALRLRNSEKEKATFSYHEFLPAADSTNGEISNPSRKRKRDIEVGVERFMAATPSSKSTDSILDTIASAVHSTILGVPDIPQRSTLWENVIILGNGSRVRGFSASLITALTSKYTLSPSTATIFTSELPSNFTTPVGTPGTNTPIPGQGGHPLHHPTGHGVNPLLMAATKNIMQQSNPHLQVPGQPPPSMIDPGMHHSHRGFSQSPTAIKTVKAPDYFPEWKDPSVSGMEEAAFLGAQVAAKVVFIVDMGLSKGFLTRTEYNELGPGGIHECTL